MNKHWMVRVGTWRLSLRHNVLPHIATKAKELCNSVALVVFDTELPPRDWAAYAAKPIETRKGAPDWIRERNEVLNRNPLVRIHNE